MHAGIYKRTESTRVSSDADLMNRKFRERIENTECSAHFPARRSSEPPGNSERFEGGIKRAR